MAFTDAQKIDIRRFLGYPVYGGAAVQAFGWRFYTWYGTLEFRMNNLDPNEESVAINFLAQLYPLEQAILSASATLNVGQAAVFTRNKDEMRERNALYDGWRKRFADFWGIPMGPYFSSGPSTELVI